MIKYSGALERTVAPHKRVLDEKNEQKMERILRPS